MKVILKYEEVIEILTKIGPFGCYTMVNNGEYWTIKIVSNLNISVGGISYICDDGTLCDICALEESEYNKKFVSKYIYKYLINYLLSYSRLLRVKINCELGTLPKEEIVQEVTRHELFLKRNNLNDNQCKQLVRILAEVTKGEISFNIDELIEIVNKKGDYIYNVIEELGYRIDEMEDIHDE